MVNTTATGLRSIKEINGAVSLINPILLNIITAIVIVLIGFIIGRIAQSLMEKLLNIVELNRQTRKRFGFKFSLEKVIATLVAYFIYLVAIVLALNTLAITTTIITTIIIIFIVVILLFLIFGLNDMFGNFFAGMYIRFKNEFHVGDYIKIKDKKIEGYIIGISLLNMRIETGKDEMVHIPHIAMMKSDIVKIKKKSVRAQNN
ncbi:MAG: mechanosensitive ion channel domain-containing protein [Candidatus Woesearchaeota archaeon]